MPRVNKLSQSFRNQLQADYASNWCLYLHYILLLLLHFLGWNGQIDLIWYTTYSDDSLTTFITSLPCVPASISMLSLLNRRPAQTEFFHVHGTCHRTGTIIIANQRTYLVSLWQDIFYCHILLLSLSLSLTKNFYQMRFDYFLICRSKPKSVRKSLSDRSVEAMDDEDLFNAMA
jgi:hypothetical protein